jgi:hypothetical protein
MGMVYLVVALVTLMFGVLCLAGLQSKQKS